MRQVAWGLVLGCSLALPTERLSASGPAGTASAPTFTKDVAPIIFTKCVTCHRPGEVAPMSLLTYNDVRPWAKAIKGKVSSREMPPWAADPRFGKFANDSSLTNEQIATVVAWVEAGAPKGDDADMPAPPAAVTGWTAGSEPDAVIEMPVEYNVPAEAAQLPNFTFYTAVPFKEDRFARMLEWRPGNRSVVHHGTAAVGDLPKGSKLDQGGELIYADGTRENDLETQMAHRAVSQENRSTSVLLVDYVPGRYAIPMRSPDLGERIPAGKYVKFGTHYQPTGRPETDRSKIGIWFTNNQLVQEVYRRQVGETLPTSTDRTEYYIVEGKTYVHDPKNGREEWEWPAIPAFSDNYSVAGATPITEPITLYGFTPHMHLRGTDMQWRLTLPDGRQETLLSIPKYDFTWQFYYELAQPMKIPAGSTITSVAHYNNTVKNKFNPAPDKDVYWSDQSWDEMYCPFMVYSVDSQAVKNGQKSPATPQQR